VDPTELIYVECGARSGQDAAGWRGYRVDIADGGDEEVLFFCPSCVEREFRPYSDGGLPASYPST
jgi:hypothetical protein